MCIVGGSLLEVDGWNPFPSGKLPDNHNYPWRPGIESYTALKVKTNLPSKIFGKIANCEQVICSVQMPDTG